MLVYSTILLSLGNQDEIVIQGIKTVQHTMAIRDIPVANAIPAVVTVKDASFQYLARETLARGQKSEREVTHLLSVMTVLSRAGTNDVMH